MIWKPQLLLLLAAIVLSPAVRADDCDSVDNLQQTGQTENTATIEWDIDVAPLKYRLTINDLINVELLCGDLHCQYEVTGLSSCNTYDLSLVAVCEVSPDEVDSEPETLEANTAYTVPGAITDVTDDGTSLHWSPPTENAECVAGYKVCYTSQFSSETICETVTEPEWDYGDDPTAGCDSLSVSLSAATGDDQYGPIYALSVTTPYGLPSEPTNYVVQFLSSDELLLEWDAPTDNPACVQDWSIVYGPVYDTPARRAAVQASAPLSKTGDSPAYSAEVTNLLMCSNYSVSVAAISIKEETGPPVVQYEQTEDAAPGELPEIHIDPHSDSIDITWGDGQPVACLSNINICFTDPVTETYSCEQIPGGDGSGGDYTIDGLVPCESYQIAINGVSPEGSEGAIHTEGTVTDDVAPGPVQNLEVTGKDTSSITVAWDAPVDYPDCVQEFVVGFTNLDDNNAQRSKSPSSLATNGQFSDTLTGLDACAHYKIDVSSVTPSGLQSPLMSINDTTDATDPGPPASPQAIASQADGITLLWYSPDQRFCVERYDAIFTPSGGGAPFTVSYVPEDVSAEEYVYTFTSDEFQECTEYSVQLQSYNSAFGDPQNAASLDASTVC